MNASRRPTVPPDAVSPRRVVEAAATVLRKNSPLPDGPFGEDIVDEVLRSHLSGPLELGPYIKTDDQSGDDGGRLGGKPRAILFDRDWWVWFARRTPEQRKAIGWLAEYLAGDEKRQAALGEMIDHYIEHGIIVRSRKKLIRNGAALAVSAFAVVQWGADVAEWTLHKIPLVREIVRALKGGPST